MYSPYNILTDQEGGYYYFYTQHNIEYRCFFTQSNTGNYIISLDLEHTVYTFDLIRYTSCSQVKFDRNISATIGKVLNDFFDKYPETIISYICDNSDSKAGKRQFSFEKWLKAHNRDPRKALIKGSIIDGSFFAGAILSNTHPEKDKILLYFETELEELEGQTNKLGEVIIIQD